MPEVRKEYMLYQLELLYSHPKKNEQGHRGPPPFVTFLLFTLRKIFLDLNDVEFDFWIGNVSLIFKLLKIVNDKYKVYHAPTPEINKYRCIYSPKRIIFTKSNDNYHGYL